MWWHCFCYKGSNYIPLGEKWSVHHGVSLASKYWCAELSEKNRRITGRILKNARQSQCLFKLGIKYISFRIFMVGVNGNNSSLFCHEKFQCGDEGLISFYWWFAVVCQKTEHGLLNAGAEKQIRLWDWCSRLSSKRKEINREERKPVSVVRFLGTRAPRRWCRNSQKKTNKLCIDFQGWLEKLSCPAA